MLTMVKHKTWATTIDPTDFGIEAKEYAPMQNYPVHS